MFKEKVVLCLLVVWLSERCKAINEVKVIEATTATEIPTKRLSYKDSVRRTALILAEGDSVTLECEFSSQPRSYIQWLRLYFTDDFKHEVLTANNTYTNGTSTISAIYLRELTDGDAGNYSCISANIFGTNALEFHVTVKEKTYCNDELCGDEGVCGELMNGYVCNCNPGYKGEHCELTDYCFAEPCLNNGSCSATNDSFNCTCPPGYKGNLCEREACLSTSCNRAGSCSETNNGTIQCSCEYNYAGKNCEYRCAFRGSRTRYCSYGTTCVISWRGTETCHCNNRDRKRYCIHETDIVNECSDPDICNRHGDCQDHLYKYTCSCHSYASGPNCELFDECRADANLCWKYGGTCVDQTVGYKCTCPEGQYGKQCQYTEKPCTVSCNDDHMEVRCNMIFLNRKLRTIPLRTNSGKKQCIFRNSISNRHHSYVYCSGRQRSKYVWVFIERIPYTRCETEVEYEEDYVIYKNSIRGGIHNVSEQSHDVITRKVGSFLFEMECKQPLKLNETSVGIESVSLHSNESLHTTGQNRIVLQTVVTYHNKEWQRISNYEVGQRLYIKLGLTRRTQNEILSNMILAPMNCYATPASGLLEPRYDLLDDGCIKDETFRFEDRKEYNDNIPRSYFSFESFAFSGRYDNKLFIHCDAKICLNKKEDQNGCNKVCQDEKLPGTATTSTTTAASVRSKREIGMMASVKSFFSKHIIGDDSVIDRRSKGNVQFIGYV